MKKKNIILLLIIYMFFSLINLRGNSTLVKQLIFYCVALIFIYFYRKDFIKKYIRYLYIIFNSILLYLLLFGKSVNGSKAWISLGFFSFQPSEFMKIILLIYLSYIVTKYEKYKLKCFIITLIPSILTFLEPDTGNVVFYFVILFSIILYNEKTNKKVLLYCGVLVVLLGSLSLAYILFSDFFINIFGYSVYYRVERILTLFDNSSFQLNRALIGIGNGHLFGSSEIASIPYETTDFAFSYLVSSIGFIGALAFLGFNLYVDLYFIKHIRSSIGIDKNIMFGFVVMKIVQESIHILMNIGLFPITGITLPFISYGGSSLLSYALILGYLSKDNYSMGIGNNFGKGKALGYSKLDVV
ncbi:MAG: FtsW/RodA/SpoVE family cell cycle protein [Erysipelotrichales bacterium]|nr:FtsW/RodA/SpoVE family cell cycle protein [Erysipelotrichales bacterium]